MNLDGLKADDRTCSAERDRTNQADTFASALTIIGQGLIGQKVKGDVSEVTFTTVKNNGDAAKVQVAGRVRFAILAQVQSQQIDTILGMVREGGR